MEDLARWLGEQLDEDEEEARRGYLKAEPLPDYDGWDKSTVAGLPPIVAARVLREIAAKRQILQLHTPSDLGTWVGDDDDKQPACRTCGNLTTRFPCVTLRLLVLPYADRPGYREEWRP